MAAGLSKLNSMRDARHDARRQAGWLRERRPASTRPAMPAGTAPNRLRRRAQAGSVDIARTWPLAGLRYAARGGSGAPILETSLERR
jgi:hypothetical protein